MTTSFEVFVSKEDFKFHAAHFVAFEGYRERLHGHNYKVGVRLLGSRKVAHDGYVVDFGDVKKATRKVCKELNEHFLCPTLSNVLTISERKDDNSVSLICQDGSSFVFPKDDCAMLPIVHATAEELAVYLWSRILDGLQGSSYLRRRGIHTMEVVVAEAVGQEAVFRLEIPEDDETDTSSPALNVADFVQMGTVSPPAPCPSRNENDDEMPKNLRQRPCCDACRQSFFQQLQEQLTNLDRETVMTADDIARLLKQL
jgi:6-pyruvoyltetrahydropterin/6-carboxytetrahydropterin synthase